MVSVFSALKPQFICTIYTNLEDSIVILNNYTASTVQRLWCTTSHCAHYECPLTQHYANEL